MDKLHLALVAFLSASTFLPAGHAASVREGARIQAFEAGSRIVSESRVLVFVDGDVRDQDALTARLPAGARIVAIRPGSDPFRQMAEAVGRYSNLDAIAIVSHGSDGVINLAGAAYGSGDLAARGADLGALGRSLKPGGDLLLYGCDVAGKDDGKAFVQRMSELVGAEVAASENATGHPSLGGDWQLEYATGEVADYSWMFAEAAQSWRDLLTITINTATNATTMRNAMAAPGTNGVTYTGTPTLNAATSTNAFGTFTTSGSNLGLSSGVILGTGNVNQVPGVASTFWDGPGTGVSGAGSERDIAQLNFAFTPNTGVTKIVFQIVMGSEEYNEYVGQGFSDNIRILLSGGAYSNTNFAVVPGTSTGIDIDTINSSLNSAYYRNNEPSPGVVTDSVLDGHTTVINSVVPVSPGTSYTTNIAVADFVDNQYNTAAFLGYFGTSINLDLDLNNSSGATGTSYQTTYTEGGSAASIADVDRTIRNYDSTSIQSATIVLTNAQAGDALSIGSLPSGISGSVNTSAPGQITVTLTGASSIANYQNAISAITFSNPNASMSATARNVTVVVNDGVTNSNTAVTTINISLPNANLVTVKTLASASSAPPVSGVVTYHITVTNNGPGNAGNVTLSDSLPAGLTATANNGTATQGTYSAGTWTAGDLANGTSATLTLEGTVNSGQAGNTITNTTTRATSNRTDPTTVGDDLTEVVTVVAAAPAMTITKVADATALAGEVTVGQTITYTYKVRNAGNVAISGVTVSDVHNGSDPAPVPGSETLSDDAAPFGDSTDAATNGSWDTLKPGDEVTFTGTYTLTQTDVDQLQ